MVMFGMFDHDSPSIERLSVDNYFSLHDLRTTSAMMSVYRDPVDTLSPIYSLLPIGMERFVAGGGRHSIVKVFDLRMPGTKPYYAAALDPCSAERITNTIDTPSGMKLDCCSFHYNARFNRRGWNMFLRMQQRSPRDSPVYSLSRPSQCSTSFFAGIENHVAQIDMVSIMDRNPDPIYQNQSDRREQRDANRMRWDPCYQAIRMSMYEHHTGPVKLFKQRNVWSGHVPSMSGWDERWHLGRMTR